MPISATCGVSLRATRLRRTRSDVALGTSCVWRRAAQPSPTPAHGLDSFGPGFPLACGGRFEAPVPVRFVPGGDPLVSPLRHGLEGPGAIRHLRDPPTGERDVCNRRDCAFAGDF